MTNSLSTPQIEALSAEIGENIYIDVAKWRLYLAEAHLHTTVAEKVASLILNDTLSETSVKSILSEIPVILGGGKREIPLSDLIPTAIQVELLEILKNYQDNL